MRQHALTALPRARALAWHHFVLTALVGVLAGCARVPSPLWPSLEGSIGLPHRGVLVAGRMLPSKGAGFAWLRRDDRHWGLPRFTLAIETAAAEVEQVRPGAPLMVGDLSAPRGGSLLPTHASHRTGRDADLLLYFTTVEGATVPAPGFIKVGADGLAWAPAAKRYLRLDVPRQWLLVRSLAAHTEFRIQWIFVHRNIKALLLEWAMARNDDLKIIARAAELMQQPGGTGAHDDHMHIRTACTREELDRGCEHSGPYRAWLEDSPAEALEYATAGDP
jgi:penicillin-insensitive murein DD-endopeptidase